MYTLTKYFDNEWKKQFTTEAELIEEISTHICEGCKIQFGNSLTGMLHSYCGTCFNLKVSDAT